MDQLLALDGGGLLGQDDELVPAEARDGVHRVNDALCTMLGYSREDLLQRSFHDSVDPDDRPRASRSLRAAMIGYELRLARQALHDPLTGLPNRLLLLQRLAHAVAQARRSGASAVVLFCDTVLIAPLIDCSAKCAR